MFGFYSSIGKKKKTVVLMLVDYDGVASYASETMDVKLRSSINTNEYPYLEKALSSARSALDELLESQSAEADIVELGVGSARQCRKSDRYSSEYNKKNGLCFLVLADLAKAHGWYFNPLLIGDYENQHGQRRERVLKPGTIMGELREYQGKHRYVPNLFADRFISPADDSKVRLVQYHIEDLLRRYSPEKYSIKVILIDDQVEILNANYENFIAMNPQPRVAFKTIHFGVNSLFNKELCDPYVTQELMDKKVLDKISVFSHVRPSTSKPTSIESYVPDLLSTSGFRWFGLSVGMALLSYYLLSKDMTQKNVMLAEFRR